MRRSPWLRLRSGFLHLTGFLRRRSMESRLREELAFHLDMETERLVGRGIPLEEARRQAMLRFGGRQQWQEASRDEYRSRMLDDLAQDLRYTRRTLAGAPGFAIAAALTLALGIGANTAVFSAVDAALFKPLPFSEPERVVALFQSHKKTGATREDGFRPLFLPWIRATTLYLSGRGPPTKMSESGMPASLSRFAIAVAAVVTLPVVTPLLISTSSL